MRQRVMIAIALTGSPKLIIADEPTTALDVTIQSQILGLLKKVQKECGASIVLITHDLGVVAEMADYVVVMYAGKIVEKGTVYEIFDNPMHPYTIGIQKAKPSLASDTTSELYSIPGNVPNPINIPDECLFKGRCNRRCEKCGGAYPKEIKITETHSVFCHLYDGE
jgi:peptide/nickel transport system ATP-binding protein